MQVELINSATGEIYSFYKDFHKVKDLDIDIPSEIMQNFQAGQDVVVKMRRLPVWEFANSIEGDASWIVRFNKQGVLIANFGGKEIPIQSLDYDYLEGQSIGGVAYIEFQVKDMPGATTRQFRLYDSGLSEPRLAIEKGGEFRPINNIEYDARANYLVIEYSDSINRNHETVLFPEGSPGEIDFGTGRVSESMRIRVEGGE